MQTPEQLPTVTITMADGGVITVELYPQVAPNTVNNFLHLVNQKFYDGLVFHRVIPGFMIQGGCPHGTGAGGVGYTIPCETAGNSIAHEAGVLSMAHAGPNTGSCQFFIMHGDAPWLNGVHTAFGHVIDGIDVVNWIATTETQNSRPVRQQRIESMTASTQGPVPIKNN